MQTHNIVRPGFFAEIVEKGFRQPTQRLGQLRQSLADFHDLIRQLTHCKTVLRLLRCGHIQIKNGIERGDQFVHLLAMGVKSLRIR
ncbi:Uncharacterised protein [Salmonella enterica subsp. enterica serovar Bovismorbificans]|uniref:Transposase n=1 Tax=Salmonella enterica subsp. enterica serovar Bovismorbificans TaxID=58097 RepID=A0A655BMZ3_SALET|nr:Uncharacterised protein [Salmonella enterica subsp. enterica serovar Bovismorbificans]